MEPTSPRRLLRGMLLALLGLACAGWVHADPPSRVARLAFTSGSTTFSPGGESDWAPATVNRPLVTGDRLWSDAASRAELQLGGVQIRLGAFTSISLLNVDDRMAQLQLAQGSLNVRVWRLAPGESVEVDTPNLAFLIRRPGNYRIDVDADGQSTAVAVSAGEAEVFGDGSAFVIGQGRSFRFWGTGLRDYESVAIAVQDDFDRWAHGRDLRWEDSVSARYVSRELIGYQDLDAYGSWRTVAGYGNVWTPRRVAANWAPYRDGHWAWIEPWGWTWVDTAPWGFAPSHYGRWARLDRAWCWVPGPRSAVPVYAPALVVFIGGGHFRGHGPAHVGWFPLGPGDVYRPSYAASRGYFTRVNTSNTVVNVTNITNVYNNVNVTHLAYVNQQVPGAVIAVPATTFTQSRPVGRDAMRVTREMVAAAAVVATAPVAPVRASLLGAGSGAGFAASVRPPESAEGRRVLSRHEPAPAAAPFASRQGALAANAGKPLDPAALAPVPAPALAAAPAVKVVTAPTAVIALPPQSRHFPVAGEGRSPGDAGTPVAPAQVQRAAAQPSTAAPTLAARPPAAVARQAEPSPPVQPVPPTRLPAARPIESVRPEAARPLPSAEAVQRNAARRAADEERHVTAPPAAIRPTEPLRPLLAPATQPAPPPARAVEARQPPPPRPPLPPPAAGRQAEPAAAAPLAPATSAAPAAASPHRDARGDGAAKGKRGEERRGGEDGSDRRR